MGWLKEYYKRQFKMVFWFFKLVFWAFISPYYLYRYLIGNIKCPNCKNWIEKPNVLNQNYLGKKTIKESRNDVHYISEGYLQKNKIRINNRYKVDKEVDYYRNTYNCKKCNTLFTLDEY